MSIPISHIRRRRRRLLDRGRALWPSQCHADREPGTWNKEPGTRNKEQAPGNKEPGTRKQETGTRNQGVIGQLGQGKKKIENESGIREADYQDDLDANQPSATCHQPHAISHQPYAIHHMQSATCPQPSAISHASRSGFRSSLQLLNASRVSTLALNLPVCSAL